MPDDEPGTTATFVPLSMDDAEAVERLGLDGWQHWVGRGRRDPWQRWEDG